MAKRTGKDSVSAARHQEVLTDPSTRHADTSSARSTRTRHRPGRGPAVALSAAVYLILSVLVWSHVWFEHPRTTTICGCGDSSLFSWFLNWPAYAIRHGLNPLYSNAMGYPHGVNLLSNTSVLALGFPLAPVTWLFGPIASLNVALTLSPFLSSMGMLVLLLRWCRWTPAAFIGGLLYGFSPYVLFTLTNSHLMLGMAPIPPLIVFCIDEIFVRQSWKPLWAGVALAVVISLQFFIGTETLAIVFVMSGIGVIVLAIYGLFVVDDLRRRGRYVVVALGSTIITTGTVLAYPTWYAFAGPAHLSGDIWGQQNIDPFGGTSLASFVLPASPSAVNTALNRQFGGYQSPTFSGQYLGIGVLIVVVLGLVLWRKDRRLQFFALLGLLSGALSLGLKENAWTPWRIFVHLPELDNVIPMRFLIVTYLCAAVTTALVADYACRCAVGWHSTTKVADSRSAVSRRLLPSLAGAAVGVIALLPVLIFLAGSVPFTTRQVAVPDWFRTAATHLPAKAVLLVFPAAYAVESSESWQVAAGMGFAMVNEGGPGGILARAGSERSGQAVLASISYWFGPRPRIMPSDVLAVRDALDKWGVTTVVLPDQAGLPEYDDVRSVPTVAAVMTAVTGTLPIRMDNAWVWPDATGKPAVIPSSRSNAVDRCTSDTSGPTTVSVPAVARCMLRQ
jgi:hypothetical protein